MKMWSKSDENRYEFQVRYAESNYGHKISQLCPLHQLFMGFVKPMHEWSKSNENRYGYQLKVC